MKKLCLSVFCSFLSVSFLIAQLKVQNLLTENLANPIGLDVQQPRFSWQLSASQRNSLQTAYEIKVSLGKKSVWSSGKVASNQSVMVPYKGETLQSGMKYSWQVKVWDNNVKASAWSQPAQFQMALLNKSDWKANWIEAGFVEDSINRPAQYFRKQFASAKKLYQQLLLLLLMECMKRRLMASG
jgi:alpha-L-rhamnosidase